MIFRTSNGNWAQCKAYAAICAPSTAASRKRRESKAAALATAQANAKPFAARAGRRRAEKRASKLARQAALKRQTLLSKAGGE